MSRAAASRQTRQYFEALVEGATDVLALLDADGAIRLASRSAERLLGHRLDRLLGRPLFEFVAADQHAALRQAIAGIEADPGRAVAVEIDFRQADGAWRRLSATGRRLPGDGGAEGILFCARDASEERRLRQRLRDSERRRRGVFDFAPIPMFIHDGGSILEANPAAVATYGYDDESQMLGLAPAMLVHPEDREDYRHRMHSLLRNGDKAIPFAQRRRLRRDGGVIVTEGNATRILDDAGALRVLAVTMDITERQAREAAHQRVVGAFEKLRDGIALYDSDDRLVLANRQYRRNFEKIADLLQPGVAFETVLKEGASRGAIDIGGAEPAAWLAERMRRHATGAVAFEVACQQRWLMVREERLDDGSTFHSLVDVTERREAERQLRLSEQRYRNIFDFAPIPMFILDDSRIREANPATAALYGFDRPEDMVGVRVLDLVHPEERPSILRRFEEMRESGRPLPFVEQRRLRRDGTPIVVESAATPFDDGEGESFLGIQRDITQQRLTEEMLRQAQKLEAVGQLTGGIAHDFNNLLTVIRGNLELLQRPETGPEMAARCIAVALGAVDRSSNLTRRLLTFSRREALERATFDPGEALRSAADLARRSLGEDIELRLVVAAAGLWPVTTDRSQFESAILNLAVNARDAMPDGGTLTIAAYNERLTGELAAKAGVEAGEHVLIEVRDTGVGMPEEVLGRIFEPFFTTKDVGRGTGLGLAMVYGFARASGGAIAVESSPGAGTVFRLRLPRETMPAFAAAALEREPEEAPAARGGEGILLVEDDADLRATTAAMLRQLGYRVREAASSAEALERLRAEGDTALVLTDVVMPGEFGGDELARRVLRDHPGVKVLAVSGYASGRALRAVGDVGVALLRKPFRRRELALKLRQVLDG